MPNLTWRTEPNGVFAEMDRLMNELSRPARAWKDTLSYGLAPAADVVETAADWRIALDLPGLTPEAITVDVKDGNLTVRAERKQPAGTEGHTWHRSERPYGTFFRSFSLPATIDAGRVEARYESGVLTVVLPKREEAKPRTIQVNVK